MALSSLALVSLEEVSDFVLKTPLTQRTASELNALEIITNGVSESIESYTGYNFVVREITETKIGRGDNKLYLQTPINIILEVKEDGVIVSSSDYYFYFSVLYRKTGVWAVRPTVYTMKYKSGYSLDTSSVPADVKLACLTWIYEYWHMGVANLSDILGTQGLIMRPLAMPAQVKQMLMTYKVIGI